MNDGNNSFASYMRYRQSLATLVRHQEVPMTKELLESLTPHWEEEQRMHWLDSRGGELLTEAMPPLLLAGSHCVELSHTGIRYQGFTLDLQEFGERAVDVTSFAEQQWNRRMLTSPPVEIVRFACTAGYGRVQTLPVVLALTRSVREIYAHALQSGNHFRASLMQSVLQFVSCEVETRELLEAAADKPIHTVQYYCNLAWPLQGDEIWNYSAFTSQLMTYPGEVIEQLEAFARKG